MFNIGPQEMFILFLIIIRGDGTLTVLDVRKGALEAASDNFNDELLSLSIIKVLHIPIDPIFTIVVVMIVDIP